MHISTIDPSGIAIIGIQELKKENESLKAEVAKMKQELQEIKEMLKKN